MDLVFISVRKEAAIDYSGFGDFLFCRNDVSRVPKRGCRTVVGMLRKDSKL